LLDNWLIGLGSGDLDGTRLRGAAPTFLPKGRSYQIEPTKKYWICDAEYQKRSMIKVSSVAGKAYAVDYSNRAFISATVIHDENGVLKLQADS
jgi:hypothetical protein